MIPLSDAVARMADAWYGRLSDADKVEFDDVLDAATEFCAHRLPIHEFARIGGIASQATGRPSPGYTRFLALMTAPPTDPRRAALRQAINAVLVFQGLVVTTAGVWTPEDLGAENALGPIRVHPAKAPWEEAA